MEAMLLAILKEPLGLPIHALWEYGILAVLGLATVSFDWERFPKGIFGRVETTIEEHVPEHIDVPADTDNTIDDLKR